MTEPAFDRAQARYEAGEPDDDEIELIGDILDSLLDQFDFGIRTGEAHTLSDRQATAAIWIDGHEYSLILNRENG